MIRGFATARLRVAPWAVMREDSARRDAFHHALGALLTRDVLQHLPPAVQDISKGPAAWADARDAVSDVYTVYRADALIGLLMLFQGQGEDAVYLGYMFAEEAWGQGYASELVAGLCAAWPRAKPVKLMGGVADGNDASARVLVKAGFAKVDGAEPQQGVTFYSRYVP